MSAVAAKKLAVVPVRWARPEPTWDEIEATAPQMVATMRRYLDDLGGLLKPASVRAAEVVLRHFAGRVTEADQRCASVAAIGRRHVEDYLVWLRARPGAQWGTTVSDLTIDHRLGLLIKFFERALSWGYADVPGTIPIRASDCPTVVRPRRRRNSPRPVPAATPVVRAKARRTGGEVTWEEVAGWARRWRRPCGPISTSLAVSARPATVCSADKTLAQLGSETLRWHGRLGESVEAYVLLLAISRSSAMRSVEPPGARRRRASPLAGTAGRSAGAGRSASARRRRPLRSGR
jgi:hypothetical protein